MEGKVKMDTNFAQDSKIVRVQALLKKAESAARLGTPEGDREAEAYNEKASELIAKYGVEQAMLAADGRIQDKIIDKRFTISDNYSMDKRNLLGAIINGMGVKGVYLKMLRRGSYQSYVYVVHIFAYESDMQRVELLFDLLQPQMLLGAAAAKPPLWSEENARSFRKSWMSGFSIAVTHRLQRNEQKAATEAGTGTDLVLFDRSNAVAQAHADAYPKLGKAPVRRLAGSGRDQGYAAGLLAAMGGSVGGSRTAALAR